MSDQGEPSDVARALPKSFGNYDVLREISSGGQARLFEGIHRTMERRVAIKLITATSETTIARAKLEAKILSGISHPNLPEIYDIFTDGQCALVMEYLQGLDLRNVLHVYKRLSVVDVIRIGFELSRALAATHNANVLHRDFKPENIFICSAAPPTKSRVRLIDFGIAMSSAPSMTANKSGAARRITQPTHIMGTPLYMSPEQFNQETIDSSSDVYSFGCTMYELLAGRTFIQKDGEDNPAGTVAWERHCRITPQPLVEIRSDIPEALCRLIRHCLEKERRNRPSTAALVDAFTWMGQNYDFGPAGATMSLFVSESEAKPLPYATTAQAALDAAEPARSSESAPAGEARLQSEQRPARSDVNSSLDEVELAAVERARYYLSLSELGSLAIDRLVEALTDAHPLVRCAAAEALAEIGTPASIGRIRVALAREPDESVRDQMAATMARALSPRLVDLLVPERVFILKEGKTTVGRDPTAEIVLAHASISRHHAELTRDADRVVIEGVGMNPILVNGAEVLAKTLAAGDVIEIGPVSFRFVNPSGSASTVKLSSAPRAAAHPAPATDPADAARPPDPARRGAEPIAGTRGPAGARAHQRGASEDASAIRTEPLARRMPDASPWAREAAQTQTVTEWADPPAELPMRRLPPTTIAAGLGIVLSFLIAGAVSLHKLFSTSTTQTVTAEATAPAPTVSASSASALPPIDSASIAREAPDPSAAAAPPPSSSVAPAPPPRGPLALPTQAPGSPAPLTAAPAPVRPPPPPRPASPAAGSSATNKGRIRILF